MQQGFRASSKPLSWDSYDLLQLNLAVAEEGSCGFEMF